VSEFPRTTKALRERLDALGVAPQKRHGQCFLTDVQAVDAIVRDAEVAAGDAVVEVGTGTGLLTHALAEAGASVDTFDLDSRIQSVAKSLRAWPETVRFHVADALEDKRSLSAPLRAALARARAERGPGRVRFVSNLPYNVATSVVLALLALADPPDSVTVMVQRELAEKVLARPGEEGYGPPSILVALLAEGRVLRRFPPQVFWPAPKVQSALLSLSPRRSRDLAPGEETAFSRFLLDLFSRRRKVLSTALRTARPALDAAAAASAIAALGVDARSRPEDVEPAALLALHRATAHPPAAL
jgi:16S rRNA (adenine1518-N6/adenine1519-N6)-dimethyltransferase